MIFADEEIFTVPELARLFNCDSETVSMRLLNGDLPGLKVGRGWIVPRKALFERLNEKAHEEAAMRRQENLSSNNGQKFSSKITNHISILPAVARGRKRRLPPPLPDL